VCRLALCLSAALKSSVVVVVHVLCADEVLTGHASVSVEADGMAVDSALVASVPRGRLCKAGNVWGMGVWQGTRSDWYR
jgi:hypothetical protein